MTLKNLSVAHLLPLSLIIFLKKAFLCILFGTIIGAACSAGYLLRHPSYYEAEGLVRGARVMGAELSSPLQLASLLKSPSFFSVDDVELCGGSSPARSADEARMLLSQSIETKVDKGTDFLRVSYAAQQADLAQQCLSVVVEKLINSQNSLVENFVTTASDDLGAIKKRLKLSVDATDGIGNSIKNGFLDKKSQQSIFLQTLYSDQEAFALRKSLVIQLAALSPPQTRLSELVAPVYVRHMKPNVFGVVVLGFIMGAASGALFFLALRKSLMIVKDPEE